MLKIIDREGQSKVSYRTGFATNASVAMYPQLWKGLSFTIPSYLRKAGNLNSISIPRSAYQPTSGSSIAAVDDRYGMMYNFSDTNSYLTFGNGCPGLHPSRGNGMGIAMSAWFRTTGGGYRQMLTKDGGSGTRFWQFRVNSASQVEFIVFRGATPGTAVGSTVVNDGELHHAFVTWDGKTIEIWVDGVFDGSLAFAGPVNTGADRVTHLGMSDTGGDTWVGELGHIAVWMYGLPGHMAAPLLYQDPYAIFRLEEDRATRVPPVPPGPYSDTPWSGSADDKLYLQSGNFTSTIKTSYATTTQSNEPVQATWDGVDTPWADSQFEKLYRNSGQFTSTVKDSEGVTSIDNAVSGIEWDGTNTPWIGRQADKMYLTSGSFTSTIKDSQGTTGELNPSGISVTETPDTPWIGENSNQVHLQSGQFTGTMKTSISLSGITTTWSDTSWDGTNTLGTSRISNKLYRLSGQFTTTIIDSEPVGAVDGIVTGIGTNDYLGKLGLSPDATVTPSEQTLTLALLAPTLDIITDAIVTPSEITMTLAQPSAVATNISLPSTQALALSLLAPTLDIVSTTLVTPSALGMTLAQPVPSYLTPDANVSPAEQSLAVSVLAPTIDLVNNPTVTPAALAITAVLRTPNVSFDETHVMSSELAITMAQPVPFVAIDETRVFPDPIAMILAPVAPQQVGQIIVVFASTLSMTLAQPSAVAPATQVDLALPLMTLDAEAYGRWNTGEYPDFEITLPMVSLEASGFSGEVLNFETSLPMLTLEIRAGIKVDMSLPLMTLEASGTTTDVGSLTKSLPMMTLEASGTNEGLGTFSKSLPMFELEISLLSGGIHSFASSLPLLELEAYCVVGGAPGDFASSLPMLTLSASGNDSQNGNLSKTLPLLTLEAFSTGYSNRFI